MDMPNKEDDLAHDKPQSGPPTLQWSVLDFGGVLKGSQMTLQQIITNTTRQAMIWLADTGEARWLTVEPDHGVLLPGEQRPLCVTANTASLVVGEYSVTLTFSSEGDTTSMSSNTIGNIVVKDPSGLADGHSLFQVRLSFGGLIEHSSRTLGLHISNPDNHQIEWRVEKEAAVREPLEHAEKPASAEKNIDLMENGSVSLSRESGSLAPQESQTIYVTANAAGLKAGYAYRTTLTFISEASKAPDVTSSSKQLVPIHFYVNPSPDYDGGPKPPIDFPPHLNISVQSNTIKGASLDFTNSEQNESLKWELTSMVSWLTPMPTSGLVGGNRKQHVNVTVDSAKLTPRHYTTDLHLALDFEPTNGHTTEIIIPVTVVIQ